MKKVGIVFSLLLVFCLSFALVGCGENRPDEPEPEPEVPAYTTLTLDETNDFIKNAEFSAAHWNTILINRNIASGSAYSLIAKNTQNGANYVNIERPIYYEYEISQICIDGQTYNYVDQKPVFISDPQMDGDSIFLSMAEAPTQFNDIYELAKIYDLPDPKNATDFIDTKKYTNESRCELNISFNVSETNLEKTGFDAINICIHFNANNQFDGIDYYCYLKNECVGEIRLCNYTAKFTTPEWFDVYDFDELSIKEGSNKLNFEELSNHMSKMNFDMTNWNGISYSSDLNDAQMNGCLWKASTGENYFMVINNNGTYQEQFCKNGTNYIYNNGLANEITTAQFSFSGMLENAYEEISTFSDLDRVITKLPFVQANLMVTWEAYVYDIVFDASSIETVNADTLCLHLEFDIKENFLGYKQTYTLNNISIGSVEFNKNTEHMVEPNWFNINDFKNL